MIGITGTRLEPTPIQAAQFGALVQRLILYGATELVHGDCVGGDALAHDLAMALGFTVHVRPPENPRFRAFRTGHHNYEPAPYMTRNRKIAIHATFLVALPAAPEGLALRSGTWATVRIARRLGKQVTLVWPDGRVELDGWSADDDQGDGHRDQRQGREDLAAGAVTGDRAGRGE